MAELRLDPVRKRWVITGKRPPMPDALDSGELCPFCPGNERFTPSPIHEERGPDGDWRVRVFHDRAPLFRVEGALGSEGEGIFDRMNALGAHEVVVESSRHGTALAELPPDQIALVLMTYRKRILDLKSDKRFRYVSVFKDQGGVRSAHDEHGHSQILATPVLPALVERELRWSLFHYRRKERCIYCDIVFQEVHSDKRVVDANHDYVCLCPYAGRFPYEIWIMPAEHSSSFERHLGDKAKLLSLATFLKRNLLRVQRISDRLHFVLHTEPNLAALASRRDQWQTIREDFHWHIEVFPEVEDETRHYGFHFNPLPAEEAARVLRTLAPEEEVVESGL